METWDLRNMGRHRGRKEEDLARYFETEYGEAEVERLLAQARRLRAASIGGIWSRLRGRLARRNQDAEDAAFCLLPGSQDLYICA